MKVVVLDAGTLDFAPEVWSGLSSEEIELELYDTTECDEALISQRIDGASAVFTNKVLLNRQTILSHPNLRFIGVLATGYNAVDIDAAREQGITVSNVPNYGTATTAQHAVALILELCNHVGKQNASVQAGDWIRSEHFSYWNQAPLELDGLTVGIVGFGQIGRRVASVLHALGASIMACTRTEKEAPDYPGFRWADIGTTFSEADIVSLHCPETKANHEFINLDLLATMKRSALLVNTARGGLIHEGDLCKALKSGLLAGAALDVLQSEPMAEGCPLRGLSNCLITPHVAWASEAARKRLLETSIDNLQSFLSGNPINVVS